MIDSIRMFHQNITINDQVTGFAGIKFPSSFVIRMKKFKRKNGQEPARPYLPSVAPRSLGQCMLVECDLGPLRKRPARALPAKKNAGTRGTCMHGT